MIRRTATRNAFAIATTLLLSLTAHAQVFRAYVSSTGSDANPCTLPAPCRLLPAALAAVADGGEIWMLDSANYNTATVTIGKSVSILAIPGAVGSVVAVGGPAISIPTASLKVVLRNLVIVPFPGGGGTGGVVMSDASALVLEDCLIANHTSWHGISASGGGSLTVSRTTISGNNRGVSVGGMKASISDSRLITNAVGAAAYGSGSGTTLSISDSIVSGNTTIGIHAFALTSVTRVAVIRSTVDGGGTGLNSFTTSFISSISLSGSAVTGNDKAWDITGAGAAIYTMGNNHFSDNTNSPTGTLTSVPLQ